MLLNLLVIYLGIGALAGTISGLFGVGGGLIMVPALVYFFDWTGMDQQIQLHMAVATSMAMVIVNAMSSARGHHKRGNISFDAFHRLVAGTVFGAAVGVLLAHKMNAWVLQLVFVIFLLCTSINMMMNYQPPTGRKLPAPKSAFAISSAIGTISAMLGIGGGSFFVPLLCASNLEAKKAVGTSALLGLPLAVVAVVVNLFAADDTVHLPDWSLGYIYMPAFVGMFLTGPACARVGSHIANKLPQLLLKRLFALLLLVIAADFCFRRLLP